MGQRNPPALTRRGFLQSGSATLIAMSATRSVYGANDRIVVAAIGTSRNEIGGDGRGSGNGGDVMHIQNFLDAIRAGAKLNAKIEEGCESVRPCRLGNISYRLGRSVHLDSPTHPIADDKEAAGMWSREYRPGWEPQV